MEGVKVWDCVFWGGPEDGKWFKFAIEDDQAFIDLPIIARSDEDGSLLTATGPTHIRYRAVHAERIGREFMRLVYNGEMPALN